MVRSVSSVLRGALTRISASAEWPLGLRAPRTRIAVEARKRRNASGSNAWLQSQLAQGDELALSGQLEDAAQHFASMAIKASEPLIRARARQRLASALLTSAACASGQLEAESFAKRALAVARASAAVAPGDALAHYCAAVAAQRLGHLSSAAGCFRTVLRVLAEQAPSAHRDFLLVSDGGICVHALEVQARASLARCCAVSGSLEEAASEAHAALSALESASEMTDGSLRGPLALEMDLLAAAATLSTSSVECGAASNPKCAEASSARSADLSDLVEKLSKVIDGADREDHYDILWRALAWRSRAHILGLQWQQAADDAFQALRLNIFAAAELRGFADGSDGGCDGGSPSTLPSAAESEAAASLAEPDAEAAALEAESWACEDRGHDELLAAATLTSSPPRPLVSLASEWSCLRMRAVALEELARQLSSSSPSDEARADDLRAEARQSTELLERLATPPSAAAVDDSLACGPTPAANAGTPPWTNSRRTEGRWQRPAVQQDALRRRKHFRQDRQHALPRGF